MLALNKERIPSPSGEISDEAWNAATIKNILSNPAYIGKVRWGRKLGGKYLQGKSPSGKQRRIYTNQDSWILVEGTHPKIINEEIFNKTQDRIKTRYILRGRAIASDGLLTGLVICGKCGRHAYYKTRVLKRKNNLTRSDYICSTHIRYKTCKRYLIAGKKLHEAIISEIDKIASNPKYREKLLALSTNKKNGNLTNELNRFNKELQSINDKQFRILKAYENNVLSLEQFGEAKRTLDDESLQLVREIERINSVLNDKSKAYEAKKRILTTLKKFKQIFYKTSLTNQKDLLQSILGSVVVNRGTIKINYRI